jgi:ABC-type transport system substrate-binding protein
VRQSLLLLAVVPQIKANTDNAITNTQSILAEQQVLRYVTLNMPRCLDPVNVEAQRITSDGIAEPLVKLNDDAMLRPWLAKSWENVEPSIWEVELQPNVKFWSGMAMDAAAVKAALERHQKLNKRATSQLGRVEISVKSAYMDKNAKAGPSLHL